MKKTKPLAATNGPDMRKEYRKELRALDTQIRRASRDRERHTQCVKRSLAWITKSATRQIAKINALYIRDKKAIEREAAKLDKGTLKQLAAFEKRREILTGRLS